MVTLTDNLIKQIRVLQTQDSNPRLMLRVMVDSGGCQGFEYRFSLTDQVNGDDQLFEKDGVSVLVDEISMPYMAGSTVDYKDDLIGAHFAVINPNAKSSCGCGTSFSV